MQNYIELKLLVLVEASVWQCVQVELCFKIITFRHCLYVLGFAILI
jgi:hypothetical protein